MKAAKVTLGSRSHVPNCKCSIDNDGNNTAPDPTCEEWTQIVDRVVATRVAEALRDAALRFGKLEGHSGTARYLNRRADSYDGGAS